MPKQVKTLLQIKKTASPSFAKYRYHYESDTSAQECKWIFIYIKLFKGDNFIIRTAQFGMPLQCL